MQSRLLLGIALFVASGCTCVAGNKVATEVNRDASSKPAYSSSSQKAGHDVKDSGNAETSEKKGLVVLGDDRSRTERNIDGGTRTRGNVRGGIQTDNSEQQGLQGWDLFLVLAALCLVLAVVLAFALIVMGSIKKHGYVEGKARWLAGQRGCDHDSCGRG